MRLLETLLEKYRRASANRGYTCDACGREIFSYPEKRLCEGCFSALTFNGAPSCTKCGRKTFTEGVCLTCKSDVPVFWRGISPFVYEGTTAALLNRFKNGERYLGFFFAEKMAEAFLRAELTGLSGNAEFLVVPVPLTAEREKARGYNQAEALARAIAERLGGTFCENLLVKVKETASQKLLTRKERAENAADAYRVGAKAACREKKILLTDDLMTTGATGNECARALLKAGAEKVVFLTAAATAEKK